MFKFFVILGALSAVATTALASIGAILGNPMFIFAGIGSAILAVFILSFAIDNKKDLS